MIVPFFFLSTQLWTFEPTPTTYGQDIKYLLMLFSDLRRAGQERKEQNLSSWLGVEQAQGLSDQPELIYPPVLSFLLFNKDNFKELFRTHL